MADCTTLFRHWKIQLIKLLSPELCDLISCFDDHVNYALLHSSQILVPVYLSSLSYYISIYQLHNKRDTKIQR